MIPQNIECWMLINGYNNYEVSSFGRIRNNVTSRILKCTINRLGYRYVALYKNGRCQQKAVHKIVGETFLTNEHKKRCIDHCDNVKTNNHVSNLRWASHSENARNRKSHKNSSSPLKGVSWNKQSGKWIVTIYYNNKLHYLGLYQDEEEAGRVYDAKAKEVYGEYGRLNFE